jgi:SAM-dependent methyltransferase
LRGVPLFDGDHLAAQADAGQRLQLRRAGLGQWARRLVTPPTPGLDLATSRCLRRLGSDLRAMGSTRPVLDVGSGAHLTDSMRQLGPDILARTIHIDVSQQFQLVDLVADASGPWPIGSESVDAVVASAMLQYLAEPHTFAQQAYRVLAPGGWLFATAPMLQPLMEAFDSNRWTVDGLRRLFAKFDILASGPTAGPATVFGRVLIEFLSVVTSVPHRRLWGPARSFWGWVFWPIKYLDVFLLHHPQSHVVASAAFILARKPV